MASRSRPACIRLVMSKNVPNRPSSCRLSSCIGASPSHPSTTVWTAARDVPRRKPLARCATGAASIVAQALVVRPQTQKASCDEQREESGEHREKPARRCEARQKRQAHDGDRLDDQSQRGEKQSADDRELHEEAGAILAPQRRLRAQALGELLLFLLVTARRAQEAVGRAEEE